MPFSESQPQNFWTAGGGPVSGCRKHLTARVLLELRDGVGERKVGFLVCLDWEM